MGDPVVTVKQGKLRGKTCTDFDGNTYYSFLGIPFAKPPLGDLRFKAPQPAEPWEGVRDAQQDGNVCYQLNIITKAVTGSEDCLYLNVSTRQLPSEGLPLRPVLVHLHGGAFTCGSGNASNEFFGSPEYLMTEDVVFVGINYRLGILGFLSLEDESLQVPGNAGLKDQVEGLKWIQENIASFNGDPNNVTIFGISAGGASVLYQVLSPLSKGLFHKAISQSGSVLNPWAWGSRNAVKVADTLGEHVNTEKDALELLMTVPVEKLLEAQLKIKDDLVDSSTRRPFSPVIEKPNPSAFLSKHPIEILKSGEFNQVPMIVGCTSEEGWRFDLMKQSQPCIEQGIPWYFDLKPGTEKYEEISKSFRKFYEGYFAKDGFVYRLYSDSMFVGGIVEFIKLAVQKLKSPVFFYQFAVDREFTDILGKMFNAKFEKGRGASHGSDMAYIFKGPDRKPESPVDVQIMRNIVKMWTNLAKYGVPTKDATPANWENVEGPNNLRCLKIDEELTMVDNPFAESTEFWSKLFEKYYPKL